ncbi:MFS transporter [Demequina aurantiaca]|uniref:MFS transporter n=1 Tax=Demequina aurantiaca TaxID=676200 RepID=UPI000A060903|nr:MFS transporter [Demequina aurantiaca]
MSTTSRKPLGLIIAAASLPMFMATLDNLVVTNALPVIKQDIDASIEQLQWVINAYSLSFASMILMAVALGDRFGRRRIFVAGIALFTVASALCALATTPELLIAARALQGAGGAAVMPLSLALLAGAVPAAKRNLAIGIWGGVAGLGVALGPLIGGAVVEGLTWHAIFWLNVPIGILAIPFSYWALEESKGRLAADGRRQRIDVVGMLLAGIGVFGVVFGIVRGNDAGWTSPQVLTGLIGGSLLLIAFVAFESRTRDPLLPLALFRDRSFSAANGVGLTFSIGIFGAVFILIQFMQVVQGKSPLEAGVMTMPWTLMPLIVAPLSGIIAPRVGTRILIVAGTAFQAAGLAWLAVVMSPDVAYATMVPGFVLAGIGMGLVFAPSSTAVLANMRGEDQAKASGTNSTIREVGVALGIAILAAVFTGAGGEFTPTGYTDAAIPAVWVGAGFLVLATLIGLMLPEGKGNPNADADPLEDTHAEPRVLEGSPA